MKNGMKLFAAGCCLLYLLLYLFLPLVAIKLVGIGAAAMNMMSVSFWCYLPLICGIAMLICSLVLDGKTGAIVCAVGAIIPLITFFLVRTSVIGDALSLFGASVSSLGVTGISQALTIGAGPILALIAGVGAAVLCYLSDNAQKPVQHTAGLGSSTDDDW